MELKKEWIAQGYIDEPVEEGIDLKKAIREMCREKAGHSRLTSLRAVPGSENGEAAASGAPPRFCHYDYTARRSSRQAIYPAARARGERKKGEARGKAPLGSRRALRYNMGQEQSSQRGTRKAFCRKFI